MKLKATFLFSFFVLYIHVIAQDILTDSAYVREHYTKVEQLIPMRDGVKLFTAIYIPKDTNNKYPFLINRTPYTVSPYGADQYKKNAWQFSRYDA